MTPVIAALEADCARVEAAPEQCIDAVLITDMPELGRLDRKAAASLADMAPDDREWP